MHCLMGRLGLICSGSSTDALGRVTTLEVDTLGRTTSRLDEHGDARAVVGDALTPHHMPQAALGFTSRAEGGALVMTNAEHTLTRTYFAKGVATARAEAGLSFRRVLARDVRDVRQIAGPKYDQGLRDLLQYYRTNFPELMAK